MTLLPAHQTLRTRILERMSGLLGTYTFTTGKSVPAIAIDDQGLYPPAGTEVQGLEVVVIPAINANYAPLLGGGVINHQSQLILKQWDSSSDTVAATLRIVGILGNRVSIGPRLVPVKSLGNIETRTITFFDAQLLRG